MSKEKSSDIKCKTCWNSIQEIPRDIILGINDEYNNDKFPQKVNLAIGCYKDENGKPYILECVRKATEKYYKENVNHEYLPISGSPQFCKLALELAYKSDFKYMDRLAAIQSISGSGALRIGQRFLYQFYPFKKKIYYSSPTWINHLIIAKGTGMEIGEYRYYNEKTKGVDFDGMIEDLKKMEQNAIVLFHVCAHNPTGVDLNHEQWQKVLEIVKEKEILPFFDMAYQGFASGDVDEDAYCVRLFANEGINMVLAQSFAKNMGLYGERIGCLSFLTQNEKERLAIHTNLERIVRSEYSNPPKFGSYIVSTILSDENLKKEWLEELYKMVKRMKDMRIGLKQKLIELNSKLNWDNLTDQKGMFSYTGLTPEQVKRLKDEYHIYAIKTGRISVTGLTPSNLEYVAKSIIEVTKE